MSGYIKRRANSQRRRSLKRRWVAGWRPPVGTSPVTTQGRYSTINSVCMSRDLTVLHVKGVDERGNPVEEHTVYKPVLAESFDEVLLSRGLKNMELHFSRINHITWTELEESTITTTVDGEELTMGWDFARGGFFHAAPRNLHIGTIILDEPKDMK